MTSVFTAVLLNWVLLSMVHGADNHSSYGEYTSPETLLVKDLRNRLRERGKPLTRPLRDPTKSIQVNMAIDLIQLVSFDTRQQIITIHYWQRMTWIDEILNWNPEEYGDVRSIRFPPDEIWTPDISLYGSVQNKKQYPKANTVVRYDGTVIWMPPQSSSRACAANTADFPCDEHKCSFEFGSWTHSEYGIDLHPYVNATGFDNASYVEDKLWILVDTGVKRTSSYYDCCIEPYVTLTFDLTLRRNASSQLRTLLIPAALLSLLSLLLFWIPAERPDRVGMGVTIYSSFFLLLLLLDKYIPPEADSKFGAFCGYNMVMTAVACVVSVLSVNVCRIRSSMPYCVKVLLDNLGPILCVLSAKRDKKTVPRPYDTSLSVEESKVAPPAKPEARYTWKNVALLLDRLSFLLYLIGIFIIFSIEFPWKAFHSTER